MRIDVEGMHWNAADGGQGDVILLVHGFPVDHTMWRNQIEALSQHGRVIAPDLPGFGQSGPIEGIFTMAQFADGLVQLLDDLQIPAVAYCGLSMGGYIGWEMWQRHRDRLKCLIQCDTRAVADTPEVARGRELMAQSVLSSGSAEVAKSMIPKLFAASSLERFPEVVAETAQVIANTSPHTIAAAQLGMAARREFVSQLPHIDLPTLFVCGAHDVISTVEEMRQLAATTPHATYAEIAAAGHMSPLENPQEFNRVVTEFLRLQGSARMQSRTAIEPSRRHGHPEKYGMIGSTGCDYEFPR